MILFLQVLATKAMLCCQKDTLFFSFVPFWGGSPSPYLGLGLLKSSLVNRNLDQEISECFEKVSLRHKCLKFLMCMFFLNLCLSLNKDTWNADILIFHVLLIIANQCLFNTFSNIKHHFRSSSHFNLNEMSVLSFALILG